MIGLNFFLLFSLDREQPGVVYYKEYKHSEEIKLLLLNEEDVKPPNRLPNEIKPHGLDRDRRNYLFKEIREFCKPGTEDLVCPKLSE